MNFDFQKTDGKIFSIGLKVAPEKHFFIGLLTSISLLLLTGRQVQQHIHSDHIVSTSRIAEKQLLSFQMVSFAQPSKFPKFLKVIILVVDRLFVSRTKIFVFNFS